VKRINPDAIILGEIWDPPARWLRGDQFDAVMNYQVAKAFNIAFVNSKPFPQVEQALALHRHLVPHQSTYVMMNLLGSHDTDRVVSQLFNPGREYDNKNRVQDLRPGDYQYRNDKPTTETYTRLKAVTTAQFCYVGSPMIYYGDEVGMWGADDPNDRKPMIWKDLEPYEKPHENHFMGDVYAHFERCAAFRNTFEPLHTGTYQTLVADESVWVYLRARDDHSTDTGTHAAVAAGDVDRVICAVNNSDVEKRVSFSLPGKEARLTDVLNDPAVAVVHATGMTSDTLTHVSIGEAAEPVQPSGGRFEVILPAWGSAVYVAR
jgi:cyclomaltodextrinase / maltogenic alpha-amylase / neopullulanase